MRFKQFQRYQNVRTHYRLYKSGRKWCVALVMLISGSTLGLTLSTRPIQAATTPTVTTTATTSTNNPTTSADSTGSTLSASSTETSTTSASSTSTATTSSTPASTASATSTTAVTSTTSTASSAQTSTATSTVASAAASSTPTNTATTSTAPTSATSLATSAVTTVTNTLTSAASSTPAVTSSASQAAKPATSAATTTTPVTDSTVVTFSDPGIENAVQTDLGVTGPITVGDIRNFKGSSLAIGSDNNILTVTGGLDGMQYLQYLPSTTLIQFVTQYMNPNIDLTPLIPDHFSELGIMVQDMAAVNLAPLLQIDPHNLLELQFVSTVAPTGNPDYQKNPNGFSNAQLAQLAPWFTAIDKDNVDASFNFDEGSLTDFAPLSGFTQMAYVVALGQRINVAQPVNLVTGQPAVFQPIPIIGIDGQPLTSKYEVTWNGTNPASGAATETPLTHLADGSFEIPTAYQAVPNANWFTYGFHGLQYYQGNRADFINVNYPNDITLRYDSMVYQEANWQSAPQVFIRYLDQATGQPIAAVTSNPGTTIGTAYDFSNLTKISNYQFDPTTSSSPTGTYTQDPQYLTFNFSKVATPAGGITVAYVDPDGRMLAPTTKITGDVGTTYTTQPATIANYTFKQLAPTSLPANGQLTLAPGTVIYQYVPTTETRTIEYWDTTTNQLLTQTSLSGAYQSVPTNPTLAMIQGYLADGYRLVSTDFPASGSPFASPALSGTYIVKLAEQFVTITPTSPDNTGLDLTKTVTRKVAFESATGQKLAPSVLETVKFERTAVIDEATGNVEYSAWHAYGPASFDAIKAPTVTNYQPTLSQLAAVPVTATSADVAKTIFYHQIASQSVAHSVTPSLTAHVSATTRPVKLNATPENLRTPVSHPRQQTRMAKWQRTLPQTSEQSQNPILGGLLSLIMLSGLAGYRRRKHD